MKQSLPPRPRRTRTREYVHMHMHSHAQAQWCSVILLIFIKFVYSTLPPLSLSPWGPSHILLDTSTRVHTSETQAHTHIHTCTHIRTHTHESYHHAFACRYILSTALPGHADFADTKWYPLGRIGPQHEAYGEVFIELLLTRTPNGLDQLAVGVIKGRDLTPKAGGRYCAVLVPLLVPAFILRVCLVCSCACDSTCPGLLLVPSVHSVLCNPVRQNTMSPMTTRGSRLTCLH